MIKNKICLIIVLVLGLSLMGCSSLGIIGGADGPTGIYVTK